MQSTDAVLVDTGPLIALLSPDDEHHDACLRQLELLRPPLFTCWPVITEAVYLLRTRPGAVAALLRHIRADGLLTIAPLDESAASWIGTFFAKFSDHEPQLADASLAYLAERDGFDTVFTLDRRDFSIYRIGPRFDQTLTIIPDAF